MDKNKSLAVKADTYVVPIEKLESNCDKLIDLTDLLLHSIKKIDLKDMDVEKKFKVIKDNVTTVEAAQRVIRLEKGQSTSNVNIIVEAIREAKKRRLSKPQKVQEEVVEGEVIQEAV